MCGTTIDDIKNIVSIKLEVELKDIEILIVSIGEIKINIRSDVMTANQAYTTLRYFIPVGVFWYIEITK